MKAVLLDIEGTTTPIDFVHKTLFPFAKARIGSFVEANFNSLANEIAQIKDEHSNDNEYSRDLDPTSPASISKYLEHLIDIDRKSTPLKSIQGKIWQEGYESRELISPVFDDFPGVFSQWISDGKTVAIYSSGSVFAQKLFFKYTDHGDFTVFLSAYFDTTTGHKRDAASYMRIADSLNMEPGDILFISDTTAELDAAAKAGFQTLLSIRKGNSPVDAANHKVISNFNEVSTA